MKIEKCINYLLTQTQSKVNLIFKQNMSEYDITPAQYVLLYHLWEEDGLSPTQLAQFSDLDTSTITGLLTRMENKGLIERRHSRDDRRGVNVYLTDLGKSLRSDIVQVIQRSEAQALSNLSSEEQVLLKKYLTLICVDSE